jgi:CDP-glycerol glycerophosphotransferase (TagB/SpsB family)
MKIHYRINIFISFLIYPFYFVYIKIKKPKKIILFGFGNDHYENNIRFLFEYFIQHLSEKYCIYAVMGKKSINIKKKLIRGKIKTYLLYYFSSAIIFDMSNSDIAPGIQKYIKHVKKFYLTHGMLGLKNVDYRYKNKRMEIKNDVNFFVASEFEKSLLCKLGKYNNIYVTGYPRFDFNNTEKKNQKFITILLTWRKYLDENNIRDSIYISRLNEIIFDKQIVEIAEKYDIYFYIKIHFAVKKILDLTPISNNRRIITDQQIDFTSIIPQSFALVTDYSSIAWDFIYFDKPVVFYQFDKELYEESQGKLYTDIVREKLGYYVSNHNDLIEYIIEIVKNRHSFYKIENKSKYFNYVDNNNTIRVANIIEENIKEV